MVNGWQVCKTYTDTKICPFFVPLAISKAILKFFSFLTLGPALPKPLAQNSMVELGENLYIIGGYSTDGSGYQKAIHELSCSSGYCSWRTLTQQLKIARRYLVAIPIDDTFCS